MYSHLIWNINPSSLMFHRQKVPLFAFQSLLCPSDLLAYPCASHHSAVSVVLIQAVLDDYCSRFLSSVIVPPSVVLLNSS
jgi:hypothetical protein